MNLQGLKSFFWERRARFAVMVGIVALGFALWGGYRVITYTVPMLQGDYSQAAQGGGDQADALYDAGLSAYEGEDYKSAKELLTRAQSALTDSRGEIPGERKAMASKIQFALGNTYFQQKQLKAAAEAYKQSLRLDPANLEAKYNLELIQQMSGGSGPGEGPPDNGPGTGGPKKGI